MLSLSESSCGPSSSYSYRASDDMSSPESTNRYLKTILMPDKYSEVAIPDGDCTPVVLKSLGQEFVLEWKAPNCTVMAIWSPASPGVPLKVFISNNGSGWGFLGDFDLSQPLDQNWSKKRLVSALIEIVSASQAAGVFTLAGVATGVYVNQLPYFDALDFNSLISYAPNAGSIVKMIPVQEGVTAIFPPNKGEQKYVTPENKFSFNLGERWENDYGGASGGWLASPWTALAGVPLAIFDTDTATDFGYPGGKLPNPNWGNLQFSFQDSGTWSNPVVYQLEFTYLSADPSTWAVTTVTTVVASWAQISSATNMEIDGMTPILTVPYNVIRVRLLASATSNCNFVRRPGAGANATLTNYDIYRENVYHPAVVSMITRVNVGQPVSVSATYNYELVPNPILSRNITTTTQRTDPICLEAAQEVLRNVGKGVSIIWSRQDYRRAVGDAMLESMTTGSNAYAAAGPSFKSRLKSFWKEINPYLSEAALSAGKAGLRTLGTAIGTAYPVTRPIIDMASRQYLAAGDKEEEEDGSKNYLAADWDPRDNPYEESLAGSQFVALVNGGAKPLSEPRFAFFPIVPAADNVNGEARPVQIMIAPFPTQESYSGPYNVVGVNVFHSRFFDAVKNVFLTKLVVYAVNCKILTPGTSIYVTTSEDQLNISGESWELAAFMAMTGMAGPCLYTGGVNLDDPFMISLKRIGALYQKAELAQRLGMKLVFPANVAQHEKEAVIRIGEVATPGYLCSGLNLPPSTIALMIQNPFDVVLFNLRIMKHRVGNNPVEQRMAAPPGKVLQKEVKVIPADLIDARRKKKQKMEKFIDKTLAAIVDLVGASHSISESIRTKRSNWLNNISSAGTIAGVEKAYNDIYVALELSYKKANAIVEKEREQAANAKGKKKKKGALATKKQNDFYSRYMVNHTSISEPSYPVPGSSSSTVDYEDEADEILDF